MILSGQELSDLIGCSPSTLSVAKKRGTLVYGRWDVASWAVHDAKGTLQHYHVPSDCPLLDSEADTAETVRESALSSGEEALTAASASALLDEEEIRAILRDEIRENPASQPESQPEDYFRPASAGGLSYVMAQAVRGDSGTARAGVLCAAALFGGLIGQEASDHWAGALTGAILVGGLGMVALRSGQPQVQQQTEPDTMPHAQTRQPGAPLRSETPDLDAEQNPGVSGGPIRAVAT